MPSPHLLVASGLTHTKRHPGAQARATGPSSSAHGHFLSVAPSFTGLCGFLAGSLHLLPSSAISVPCPRLYLYPQQAVLFPGARFCGWLV